MKKLKCVVISDTHMMHNKITDRLPSGDVLIHAGDALNFGSEKEWFDFCMWWRMLPYQHKVFVAGNHDRCLDTEQLEAHKLLLGEETHFLYDSQAIIEGKRFYGSPIQKEFCNWAFNRDEISRERHFKHIPEHLDVLITHEPPLGYGDYCPYDERIEKKYGPGLSNAHVGDPILRKAIDRLIIRPKYHIFGHIHYSHGIHLDERKYDDAQETTVFINAAICDDRYKPINNPIVFYV